MDTTSTQQAVSRLRTYLSWHAGTAIVVFLFWFALWMTIIVPSFGVLISIIPSLPMFYPLVAGILLFKARSRLADKSPDAPRWIRWSMAFALPGSIAVGVGSVAFALMGVLNGSALGSLIFVPFIVVGLSSVFVLLRVVFKTDIDELLWSEAGEDVDAALNYSDEEDVELDFMGSAEQAREVAEARRKL